MSAERAGPIEALIGWSLRHRGWVLGLAAAAVVAGALSLHRLDVDAFPDTTPVQVQINAVAPALGPEQIELQVTAPVERALAGMPGLAGLRSTTKAGFAQVVATFDDETDLWFARRLVSERLDALQLPEGLGRPTLGPVATGLGEVFHYIVSSASGDLTAARTAQDWILKPALASLPGVAEVNSWGGHEKQYEVAIDPSRLVKHDLTFAEVVEAVADNNLRAGGGSIASGGGAALVQGLGAVTGIDELSAIVVAAREGVPVRLSDVAEIRIGAALRQGAVSWQGRGEAVLGLGFLLVGENPHDVTSRLKARLAELAPSLPPDLSVTTVYDRTGLVDQVIDTVRRNLFEGGLLVVAVLFVFLGSLRAGLIVASAIPLSMLFAFSGMLQQGIAASLMSLGALDFGLIVDSAVIQVENAARHVAADRGRRPLVEVVRTAAIEVRRPTLFGELIIVLVYVPILALEGVEGRLFRPMALTVIFALLGSLVLSLTVVPALSSWLLPRRGEPREPLAMRVAAWLYRPVLAVVLRRRGATLLAALAAFVAGVIVLRGLGSEFIPRLSEGALAINVVRLAGTSLEESVRANTAMERALLAAFPHEIEQVWSRIGTAEVATDPMGTELSDIFLALRPRDRWRRAATQDGLAALVQRELRDMPGQRIALTQPIEMRMNEMVAGARGDVALKLLGDDLDVLAATAARLGAVLGSVPGAADLTTSQVTGQPVLEVAVDRDALARHAIPARAVMDVVSSIGGLPLGEVMEGQLRFPLVARLPERERQDAAAIGAITVSTSVGQRIPLSALASVREVEGPATITREWGQRCLVVQANVVGRDLGGFVAEARRRVAAEVDLPPGRYRVEWGGQFQHLERARRRLLVVVPAVLVLIGALLFLTYRSLRDALRVFTGVPFAVLGGVAALWVRGMPFSISAAVGFIALSGVAVLGDMVLVSRVRQLLAEGRTLREAVEEACLTRLRPVLMTGLVASLGLLPMALSAGVGAEVQRPLATVVIGGVLSSTLLTLLVLPALYLVWAPRARPA